MQRKSRTRVLLAVGIGLALLVGVQTAYADLLFDRGLPTENLNNASNPRSNFAFYSGWYPVPNPSTYFVFGDDFMISGPGPYHIDIGRVWVLYHSNPDALTGLKLWGGEGGTMELLSSSFTATRVYYANGKDFESSVSPGVYYKIWQIDFAVNRDVEGGQKYQFFVDGSFEPFLDGYASLSLHASIADLSGSTQEGADNYFSRLTMNSGVPGAIMILEGEDINLQLYGRQVPVPGTLVLLGSGLLGLVGWRRFRKD